MSNFIVPPKISPGDTVGLIAPSDAIDKNDLGGGVATLESWGLKVKLGKHLLSKVGDFSAGTPQERQEDLINMIEDNNVRIIWAASGGYAATEILHAFTKEVVVKLRNFPKWFIGYSDVCVILNALASFKLASIHGPNLSGLHEWDKESQDLLKEMLFNGQSIVIDEKHQWKPITQGTAVGILLISNLDSLIITLGTRFDPLMFGSGDVILGIEEWFIEKSTLQRQIDMIVNHKRAKRIKGMILGRFIAIEEESYPDWGKKVTIEELIKSRLVHLGEIPLAQLNDFGHYYEIDDPESVIIKLKEGIEDNKFLSIPNGVKGKLSAGEKCSLNIYF
ncbi:hypothetical protein A2961_00565 [Candidatus Woesebacteria bacterium RIFCSPLOWO2_01_FULL_39_21]|uniref:LD-carboxypeptidase n=1 Tax=Candidatus Woesebacteria bacterium RIFCSPLOWO2_01_FULL_39_21 TaxID=1802519 RepID=A0A1F8BBR7_9BACT|nr:MAG: hypothetical protein A2691_01125 [Candidatus Woesebacteria bacterium RIFCSPHIGHO2_01_FULL_39_23]OGM61481.1 MAG: hypothetical protein A2961_00565 [Candidatus Woesebacteria bacterium RIFCSPLOWO2_01_FULL_39_21]